MNTPVSPELDRLLLEKNIPMLVNPTIADVVMWLYEKHGIWISVDPENDINDTWFHTITNGKSITAFGSYSTLTEAYEKGIKHILNEMI